MQPTRKRSYIKFTPEQEKLIKESNGIVPLADLAKQLGINYTNLSGALRYHRIVYNSPKKEKSQKPVKKRVTPELKKEFNEDGEEILTDKMMLAYSYMT